MALARKDVRVKLSTEMHAALKAIADVDDVEMGVFIENLLVPVIEKRIHEAIVLAKRLHRLGLAGSEKDSRGSSGNSEK